MADAMQSPRDDDIEKPARDVEELARKWCAEIQAAEKAHQKWLERGAKIEKIYADDRDPGSATARKMNVLYANVEALLPAVYMRTPKAKCVRRYRDRDPVARLASMILERCIQTSCDLYEFDQTMFQAVRDRLLPGRGQAWVTYEPTIEGGQLTYENVVAAYVPWQDFLHSPARTWAEVRWVARRFYKTRGELGTWLAEIGLAKDAKAGKKAAKNIQLDYSSDSKKKSEGDDGDERGKAQIWEIHDKTSRSVIYLAPGSNEHAILGQKPPAIQFMGFFPCPRPLLGITTSKGLIPTPDYAQYQDQAKECDETTARIAVLQKALAVKGVYASDMKELAELIEASDNRMIPVSNWAMFAEGGGAKGRIEWFPIDQVMEVLKGLYEIRAQAKMVLDEVSGMSDILRGVTDPDETATAQSIKSKWGSLRVRRIQKDVQRFAADILRLKAEVIAEAFQPRTLMSMAGIDQEMLAKFVPAPEMPQLPQGVPPEAAQQMAQMAQQQASRQFMEQVFALLKDDTARNFRIEVESDSTLEPDMQEEKQAAIEFLTAMGAFLEQGTPIAMQGPEAAKMIGEMLTFAVRRFDKVESLEQVIEQAVEAAAKPREPQPDPEMAKVQAQAKKDEGELKIKATEVQGKLQLEHKRIEEVEKPKVRVDAILEAAKVRQQGQQMEQQAEGERENRGIEREKLAATKENNDNVIKLKRREQMSPEEREDADAQERGKPTTAEVLMALLEEMKRPVTVRRGEDGLAVGLE